MNYNSLKQPMNPLQSKSQLGFSYPPQDRLLSDKKGKPSSHYTLEPPTSEDPLLFEPPI